MGDSISEKGRLIAIKASAVDSGASEEVFSHGNYGPDFMDVPSLFATFENLPDPEALRSHAASINDALKYLVYETELDLYPSDGDDTYPGKPEFDAIGLVSGETSNWIGDAADSFTNAIAVPAQRIIPNQFWAARTLKLALEAEASLWTQVNADIHGIADETLSVLEHVEDKGAIGIELGVTVLGSIVAVAGALAAPATGGATLALALTVYGAATSVIGEAEAVAAGIKVQGDSPQEVVSSMREGIAKLKTQIYETEEKIATGLTNVVSNIGDPVFHFAKPNLVKNRNFSGHA